MSQFTYFDLQNNLVNWAEQDENVQVLLLIGSRARKEHGADPFSDLDAILFSLHPPALVDSNAWLRDLEPFWFSYLDQHAGGIPEQFALYDNALKIDVLLVKIQAIENLQFRLLSFPYNDVLQRGFKVLVDKTSSKSQVAIPQVCNNNRLPDQPAFENHIYYGLTMILKTIWFLERDDLLRAFALLNNVLRNNLLVLMEWEVQSTHPEQDTWYDGRFINHWGNPEIISKFPEIFTGFQKEALSSGLRKFLQVYSQVARKIAMERNITFPTADFRRIMGIVFGI